MIYPVYVRHTEPGLVLYIVSVSVSTGKVDIYQGTQLHLL